jgi:hypothetical protein
MNGSGGQRRRPHSGRTFLAGAELRVGTGKQAIVSMGHLEDRWRYQVTQRAWQMANNGHYFHCFEFS